MEKAELIAMVARAQSGDQAAMEVVLREAHTSVSYQCRKLLRDPRDAEDMTQEVLLAVYTKLDTLKTPEAFWGWLNQTTANRCVNAMKRNRVEFQFAEDEEGHSVLDNLEELDQQQVPDKALDNAETTRMIEEIVDGLPDAQRACTLMYYYDEMSVKEIASVLGVSENTVKSRLNYARKAVKERVLDYEKKGVKLYGLSPLPFILFFLLRAAGESADGVKAAAAAKKIMEVGAASVAAGGAAAAKTTSAFGGVTAAGGNAAAGGTVTIGGGTTAAGGGAAAAGGTSVAAGGGSAAAGGPSVAAGGGSAAAGGTSVAAGGGSAAAGGTSVAAGGGAAAAGGAAVAGGLSVKVIAGTLAGLLLVGGGTAAVVIANQSAEEPEAVISEVMTEPAGDATEFIWGETEEPGTPPVEEELIPAERLALLNDITYYGDPAQCRMTVNQARAYAEVIETRTAELVPRYESGDLTCYAALIDVGEGNPVLALARGADYGEHILGFPDPDYHTSLHTFEGKLEIWQYVDGQAELVAATHSVYWKAGEAFVCSTRVGGTEDDDGNVFADQSHYLDFAEEVYRVEGGVISAAPIASAWVEVDLIGDVSYSGGGTIDGQFVGEAVWPAWKALWDEGGQKSIVISGDWSNWSRFWAEDGWTGVGLGYDVSWGGHVDQGIVDVEDVSPGSDTADVLRRCAGN